MYRSILTVVLCLAVLFTAGVATAENRTEVMSMRSEYAKVFDNHNGTYTAEVSNKPVHKQNVYGEWVEVCDTPDGVA